MLETLRFRLPAFVLQMHSCCDLKPFSHVGAFSESLEVRLERLFSRASSIILANIAFENLDGLEELEVHLRIYTLLLICLAMIMNMNFNDLL